MHLRLPVLILLLIGCGTTEQKVTGWESARIEFTQHQSEFEAFLQTPESFVMRPGQSPSGLAITSMGKRALPFVMEEIGNGHGAYKWLAQQIVAKYERSASSTWDEALAEKNAFLQEVYSRDWIKWWESEKKNPEWNIFLSTEQGIH